MKSFAAAGATKLQLDPEAGLVGGYDRRDGWSGSNTGSSTADKEIVTIDPPLTAELPAATIVRKVTAFAPFDGTSRNRQEHALYLGHSELLDIEAAATIAIVGAESLSDGSVVAVLGQGRRRTRRPAGNRSRSRTRTTSRTTRWS